MFILYDFMYELDMECLKSYIQPVRKKSWWQHKPFIP